MNSYSATVQAQNWIYGEQNVAENWKQFIYLCFSGNWIVNCKVDWGNPRMKMAASNDDGVVWDDKSTRRVLWQLEVLIYVSDNAALWIIRNSMRNFF